MKVLVRAAALAVASVAAVAAPARADVIITPFVGKTFAAQTTFLLANVDKQSWTLGGSATWLTDGVLGAEIDFGYAPRFFGPNLLFSDQVVASVNLREPGSNVVTLTGNVVLALPLSVTRDSLRPYVSGGLGVLHAGADDLAGLNTVDRNLLALSLGGGAIGFLNNRAGVRFDLRHIRSTSRDVDRLTFANAPRLGFWRATIGVALRY